MKKHDIALLLIMLVSTNAFSGSLEPTAPPASTMKSLDEVPPTWSQKLDENERFVLVLGDDAVLDKETGLVWEREPRATPRTWNTAVERCYQRGTGGRAGWRLPTAPEMASLFEWGAGLQFTSNLPFIATDLNECRDNDCHFWTSTTVLDSTTEAYSVRVNVVSDIWQAARVEDKTTSLRIWCVRGGSGHVGP